MNRFYGEECVSNANSFGIITCPVCSTKSTIPMPDNACVYFFKCPNCEHVIRPKEGDCCVFCSYGEEQCTPKKDGI